MRTTFVLTIFIFTFSIHLSKGQTPGSSLFDTSKIHEIKIVSLYESLIDSLTSNYILSFGIGQIQVREIPYAQSLLIIDGTVMDTLGIRYKGFNSWWNSVKKPIKIDINKYKDQKYDGLSKFNLHNGSGDPSFIRENIDYKIFRSLGIKAPRTSYAKVYIDTTYLGLYRIVEQVDNTFLDTNFGTHEGNVYAQQSLGTAGYSLDWLGNNQEAYYGSLALENHQKTNDWSALLNFLDVLNDTPDDEFRNAIISIFDVDEYLQILAFEIAVNNIDGYGTSGRNYYLAEVNGKFHWIPWDYNLTWREDEKPLNIDPKEFPVLIRRLLNVPEFYTTFLRKYCELKPYFSEASISRMVADEFDVIKSSMQIDPFLDYPFEAFETNMESSWEGSPGLKQFAAQRYADITSMLESLHVDCSVISGIPDEHENDLLVYPVPANNFLTIDIFSGYEASISMFNNLGDLVLKTKVYEKGVLDTSQLSSGCYTMKIIVGTRVYSKFIVIEH